VCLLGGPSLEAALGDRSITTTESAGPPVRDGCWGSMHGCTVGDSSDDGSIEFYEAVGCGKAQHAAHGMACGVLGVSSVVGSEQMSSEGGRESHRLFS
jgi:hypothetical protein